MANINGIAISGAATGSAPTITATGGDTNVSISLVPAGTGQVSVSGDISATGGYRQWIDGWYQDDVPASQSAVALRRVGSGDVECAGSSFLAPRAGSVTAVAVYSNAARTGGTLMVTVTINGAATSLTATLDGTNTTFNAGTSAKDTIVVAAGDLIGATITTDASWAPTTADIRVTVELEG